MTTAILAPSTRRSTSSKDRPATASPLTAGEVVLQALHATTKALRKAERKVRDGDPQAVSQTRVAARQLRSTLRGFSRLLDRQVTRPLLTELAWLGRQLGEQNDTQSTIKELRRQHDLLPPEFIVGPVVDDARMQLDQLVAHGTHTTLATLDSDRHTALREGLDRLLADRPSPSARRGPQPKNCPRTSPRRCARSTAGSSPLRPCPRDRSGIRRCTTPVMPTSNSGT